MMRIHTKLVFLLLTLMKESANMFRKKTEKWVLLLLSFAIMIFVQIAGAAATRTSVNTWYQTLIKPSITPPDAVFGPVWAALYILIAFSLWLIWIAPKRPKSALPLFFIQLGLNFLWTWFFFKMQNPLLGLIDILLLIPFLLATIIVFWKTSRIASMLLWPYFVWVVFAAILNWQFVVLN